MVSSVPGQSVDVARFFPALRELVLLVFYNKDSASHIVNLSGLTMDTLTVINDGDAPIQYTAPSRIGVVKDLSSTARYDAGLWPSDTEAEQALTARIHQECHGCSRHRCEVLSVGSLDGGEPHYVHYAKPDAAREMYWQRYAFDALAALPQLRARLVSLTIEDAMIARLLDTDSTFAALRELFVACSAAPPPKRKARVHSRLRCPALERITLFPAGNSTPVSVGRERIAPLSGLRDLRKSILLVLARVSVN